MRELTSSTFPPGSLRGAAIGAPQPGAGDTGNRWARENAPGSNACVPLARTGWENCPAALGEALWRWVS